uniref:NADH dehydrogenase subunit 6 n=1 Tax=Ibla cumingi TaxID=58185 RepID=UPI0021CC64D5|nr:NADH dehydrogenase subunit 6 [Ibla cumingi]UWM12931.1 NADH dehydrogenase subunit 6 [Ibla cumingi]
MISNALLSMIFLTNLGFLITFHPLAMIFVLIAQSILSSMAIYHMTQFPWFSYTITLVFLGGMLIIFTYMSNIASNELFKPNLKMLIPSVLVVLSILLMKMPSQNFAPDSKLLHMKQTSELMISKPFAFSILPLTLLMGFYIIVTLLAVVKISKMHQGPLRLS